VITKHPTRRARARSKQQQKMRHVAALLLHVVACGCGAQPPPGSSLPERRMQANATRLPSRTAPTSRRSVSMAQESSQPPVAQPVARPVVRPASGNASALDPHNKIKAELRVEFGERFRTMWIRPETPASGLSPEAPFSTRSCQRLPRASVSLGRSAAWSRASRPIGPTGPCSPQGLTRTIPALLST
jgi:hypothetical protein